MKRILFALIAAVPVLLCLAGCAAYSFPVEITVFSVGKADAILVRVDEAYMLIDCGEADDEEYIMSELDERGITHLDILEITHFDKDHVGSAAAIVKKYDIETVIYPDYEGTRKEYTAFMAALKGKSGAFAISQIAQLTLGSATLGIYPADDPSAFTGDEGEYDNELSLVTRMEYGEKVFLFCGDVEKSRLKQMKKDGTPLGCDWMKLPHHGKYCKQMKAFLEAAAPEYCVMTISEDEPADEETTALLDELGIKSYDTLGGDITVYSDGKSIVFA